VALERLRMAALLGRAMQPGGLGLGSVDDGGPDVRFEGEMDVDHAELVAIAAGTSGVFLASGEVSALLGLEDDASGAVS
jgi:hypothetical protein